MLGTNIFWECYERITDSAYGSSITPDSSMHKKKDSRIKFGEIVTNIKRSHKNMIEPRGYEVL
jgi:hypothetical protein